MASSQGKTSCTPKLTAELIRPTKEMAIPRIRLGKSSEKSTHMTGPMDTANEATKPSTPKSTSHGFIAIAALMKSDS